MDECLRRQVVEVKVQVGAKKKKQYQYVTGFPVSKHHVLTVKHVLEKCVDKNAIELRFPNINNQEATAEVVWEGKDEHVDAALLCTEHSFPCHGTLSRGEMELRAHQKWEGVGIPGLRNNKPIDIGGIISGPPIQNAQEWLVEVTFPEPKEQTKWAGNSGAPIEVRGMICGLLRGVAGDTQKTQLAVPAKWLLDDEEFCKTIGWDEGKAFRQEIENKVRELLENNKGALHALAKQFKVTSNAAVAAKTLMDSSSIKALAACNRAHHALLEPYASEPEQSASHSAKCLERVVVAVLPVLYKGGLIQQQLFDGALSKHKASNDAGRLDFSDKNVKRP